MRRRKFKRKPTHLGNKNAQDLNIIFVWKAGSGVGGGGSGGGSKKSVPSSSSLWAQGQVTGGRKEGEEEKRRRRDEEQREGGKAGESRQDLWGLQGCVEQMPNILTLPWPNIVQLSGLCIQLSGLKRV